MRVAQLPKALLTALRERATDRIALAICHMLFMEWLRCGFGGSHDRAIANVLPSWNNFVAYHPFAREIAPTEMGLCQNRPVCKELLNSGYLPAKSISKIDTHPRASTTWHAVDPTVLGRSLAICEEYSNFLNPTPPLTSLHDAIAFAEAVLFRSSPRWLTGWRDVARSTDERTLVGGVLPLSAVGHTQSIWCASNELAKVLPALMSSFVCDFVARLKSGGTHLSFFVVEQIPVLRPEVLNQSVAWGSGESVQEWILPRILELTYTASDLKQFAANCGWNAPPFPWDDDRRFLLRCELDAAFFHLYLPADEDGHWRMTRRIDGYSRDETTEQLAELERRFPTPRDAVSYIMSTFPTVRRKNEVSHGEYRAKRVVLGIYETMQNSIYPVSSTRSHHTLIPRS